jgi:hypothetical protein
VTKFLKPSVAGFLLQKVGGAECLGVLLLLVLCMLVKVAFFEKKSI